MNKLTKTVSNLTTRHIASVNSILFGSRKRKIMYAVLTGTGIGAGYAVLRKESASLPALSNLTDKYFANSLMKRSSSTHIHKIKYNTPNHDIFGRLTLYQFFSYYDIVEVNSVSKRQLKWSDYKKVPILVIEDEQTQLNDSNVIISLLEAKIKNRDVQLKSLLPLYGPNVVQQKGKVIYNYSNVYNIPGSIVNSEEAKWREWVDKELISIAGLSIYDTIAESIRSFKWFSKAGKWPESFGMVSSQMTIYSGAILMYLVSKWRKGKSSKNPDLQEMLKTLAKQVSNAKFIGGEHPNLADVSAYGALMALRGCDKFAIIISDKDISDWWIRMQRHMDKQSGSSLINSKQIQVDASQSAILHVLVAFLLAKLIGLKLINDNVI
ncbi:hypothetical protein GJ496_004504 [Pomphorhynchus laevis]|nr:hypothetical protein GJ496_004504 [Pomphorhynchus laevis]